MSRVVVGDRPDKKTWMAMEEHLGHLGHLGHLVHSGHLGHLGY